MGIINGWVEVWISKKLINLEEEAEKQPYHTYTLFLSSLLQLTLWQTCSCKYPFFYAKLFYQNAIPSFYIYKLYGYLRISLFELYQKFFFSFIQYLYFLYRKNQWKLKQKKKLQKFEHKNMLYHLSTQKFLSRYIMVNLIIYQYFNTKIET